MNSIRTTSSRGRRAHHAGRSRLGAVAVALVLGATATTVATELSASTHSIQAKPVHGPDGSSPAQSVQQL
jgi:hypothetical protein